MSPRVWGCWKSLWCPVFLCNHPDDLKHWNRRAWKPCGNPVETLWKLSKQVFDQWLKLGYLWSSKNQDYGLYRWDMCQKRPPTKMIHFLSTLKTSSWSCAPPKKLCQLWAFPEVAVSGLMKIAGMLLAARWVQFSGEEHLWCVMKLGLLCFLEVGDSNMDGDGPASLYLTFRPQYSALFWENPTSKFCPHLPGRWHQELLQSLLLTVSMKNAIFSIKTTTISI